MFYDGSVVGDGRVIRDFLVIFGAPSILPSVPARLSWVKIRPIWWLFSDLAKYSTITNGCTLFIKFVLLYNLFAELIYGNNALSIVVIEQR